MSRILADTGPLYAAYDSSDRYHQQAQQELSLLNQQQISIMLSGLVLAECHSLLLKRFNPTVGIRFLKDIEAGAILVYPSAVDFQVIPEVLQRYADQTITLCDAMTGVMGDRLSLPIWTYDFHFDVMGCKVWQQGRDLPD